MVRHSMYMDRKTQYCQYISADQFGLLIQRNSNQNPSKLFCRYEQTDSKVYMEKLKTQNGQLNTEGKELNRKTDTTQLQDLL